MTSLAEVARWLRIAALVGSAIAAAQQPSPPQEPDTAANVLEHRAPFQRFPRLGPKAVGLLLSRNTPWGHAGHLEMVGPRAFKQPDVTRFFVEGRSGGGWRASVPVPGSKPAQLVRVTVNGGKGYFGDGALYTDVEVLDGTPETPIVVARAMDEAKARWDRYLASQKPAFDRVMEEGRRRVEAEIADDAQHPPDAGTAEARAARAAAKYRPDEDTPWGGFFASWRDDPGELMVLFGSRLSRQRTRSWKQMQVIHCPPGAPCMPPMMGTSSESKVHGAAVAYAVTFDRAGKIIREEPFPPVPWFQPLPPYTPLPPWRLPPTVQPPRGARP